MDHLFLRSLLNQTNWKAAVEDKATLYVAQHLIQELYFTVSDT